MTTVTEAPLIVPDVDVDELPALDQPDERACEFYDHDFIPCEQLAVWALTFRELCGCSEGASSLLLACDGCRAQVEADCQAAQCLECLRYLPLLRAEPL